MNDYPLDFIFNTINLRLKSLLHNKTLKQNNDITTQNDKDDMEIKTWFTIPYTEGIDGKFREVVRDLDVNLSFYSLNKLNCFIGPQKDRLSNLQQKNVIYKINCKDCDASYVGQTKRTLKTRVKEHKNDIRKSNGNLSVLSEHRLELNHEFDWDDVKVVDSERWLYKRRISEMLHIKLQNNSLNLQSDTDFLHHSYLSILNNLH
ncbi:hypothetical protein ALC57_18364 [Trachymyrmex cornetzi]|uniref:GIY-YIG domain-containing protein n=1 Tax=Trachymyrmex cornetzi TaxID=471704 RepID=A0A151IS59_9HYME|nr:hypothetical protein ALC57_18364 [Trachymyrmex cornetzi]